MLELFFSFVIICAVIDIVGCCAGPASYSDTLYYPQMNQLDESQRATEEGLKSVMSEYDTT